MVRGTWLGRFAAHACVVLAAVLASVVIGAGCKQADEGCHPRCDGNTKVACELDPPIREDCGSRTCVEDFRTSTAYAACAIGGRDQRCNPEIDDVFCDGDKITSCRGAFVENVDDCGARGLHCAVASFTAEGAHWGQCVSSLVPDARCAGQFSEARAFCDGDFRASCFGRFVIRASQPCSVTGQHCVDLPTGGERCE